MAFIYSYKRTRLSAAIQILLGFLFTVFGIADRFEITKHRSSFPALYLLAVWIGCMIIIVGIIGVGASLSENHPNKSLVVAYLVSSILSTLLAMSLTACYGASLYIIDKQEGNCKGLKDGASSYIQRSYGQVSHEAQCKIRVKLAIIMIVFGVAEVLGAVWSIGCCCTMFTKNSRHQYELPDETRLETIDDTPLDDDEQTTSTAQCTAAS
ncbi:uncharacterized protein LOC116295352 [Actinia tenebrosa]|uniref:Uncharacterized protein LOC116295352 n=1 Tax=Actinia tenebrosa TaxID=6105 RepID=A0A6P8HUC1_ACTTE|nr:uncharacterized protein LOC116295352 [Actinia tenebrosa]